MKKILITTNILSITIFYLFSCTSSNHLAEGSFQVDKAPIFSTCYNCMVDDIHGETAEEFSDVTARYKTTHFDVYNSYAMGAISTPTIQRNANPMPAGFEDARSCWYSVDTLKKFICLMEKYSKKSGLTSADLGVRFYYANYPANYPRDNSLSKHHTLFLTATAKQGSINVDFDPRISAKNIEDGGKEGIVTIASLIDSNNPTFRSAELFMIAGNTGNATMNQGDLCPPGSGCTNTLSAVDAIYPSPHP